MLVHSEVVLFEITKCLILPQTTLIYNVAAPRNSCRFYPFGSLLSQDAEITKEVIRENNMMQSADLVSDFLTITCCRLFKSNRFRKFIKRFYMHCSLYIQRNSQKYNTEYF